LTLAPGSRLGPYEILAPIGAGGMGEVYRARDARLKRDVAIKVLPSALARDAERLARFQREAQVLASLNHSQIAAIYGLEDAGGVEALVLELVDGETLAERIARGPIAPDEAMLLARQIAEGLEYAHERGIVHRDLKPANVKITPEGKVKLLDFGLAKALESGAGAGNPDLTSSPTLTGAATGAGVVMGTAAYMSPEQARGKPVDKRADIWAFGCVLYEMLSGRKAFEGENVTDTLAALVRDEPDWKALPRGTPPTLRRLLERCLAKDATRRLQAIGEARIELEELAAAPRSGSSTGVPLVAERRRPVAGRRVVWVALGVVVLLAAVIALWRRTPARPGASAPLSASAPGSAPGVAAVAAGRSLAVLPFRNLSGDPANDYFSDGISEEILNALTRLPGLKVIGRTSSFRFRGPDVDVGAVGKQLGVGTILSGSVQKSGDAVRVTAELVDAGNGYQLWSQKYDRKLSNLFELEDEISRSIADALRVQLVGGAAAPPLVSVATASPEAHNLVLRASALSRRSDEASLNEAIRLYREAVALDPHYAAAWAGMIDPYAYLADAYRSPREIVPLTREAAERAIAIDPSFGGGHAGLATVDFIWGWNFPAARREFEQALALDPGAGMTRSNYGLLLATVEGDVPRSRAELASAASQDPLNPFIPYNQVLVEVSQRDYAAALRHATRIREIDPNFLYFVDATAMVHIAMGRWDECVREQRELPEPLRVPAQIGLAICLAHTGGEKEARGILASLEKESKSRYVDASTIGAIYAALGQKDQAFAWIDEAVEAHSGRMPMVELWPDLEPLRSDPRFDRLVSRIGVKRRTR
jgi:serine/threonine-protein kinase